MKFEMNEQNKKVAYGVVAVVIIAVLVILLVTGAKRKRADQANQSPENTAVVEEGSSAPETGASTKTPAQQITFKTPSIESVVTNVSSSEGDSATDTKRGMYSIMFKIVAKEKDVYFNPVCQSVDKSDTSNGITFALIKDGVRADNSGFIDGSCVVLNRGTATQLPSKNYLISKGQENVFELVVTDHPKAHGSYKLRVVRAGYSSTDSARANAAFEMSQYDADRLKTQAISL